MRRALGSDGGAWARRAPRWGDDEGAGTVLAIALSGVVVLIGLVLGAVGAGVVARSGAQSAADLAALAAGDVLALEIVLIGSVDHGGSTASAACERAGRVAARNGAALDACAHEGGGVVVVHVSRATPIGPARAAARAGPRTTFSPSAAHGG